MANTDCKTCPVCRGDGEVKFSMFMGMMQVEKCGNCNGKGVVKIDRYQDCKNSSGAFAES